MKIFKITLIAIILSFCIYSLKDFFGIKNIDYDFLNNIKTRNLQKLSFNISKIKDLLDDVNYTDYRYSYGNTCNSTTITTSNSASILDKQKSIDILGYVFRKDDTLSKAIQDLLKNDSENFNASSMITPILKLLIPSLVLIGLTLLGWFTCCSCCCYEYCPILFKRVENIPYTSTNKLVPVILVIFSGLSLIIPALMAFNRFNLFTGTLEIFYCKITKTAYMMGKKEDLSNTLIVWNGFEDDNYYQNMLNNTSWLDLDTSKTLDRVNEFEKQYFELISYFDNYTEILKIFPFRQILYPSILNRNLTRREEPDAIRTFSTSQDSLLAVLKRFLEENFYKFLTQIKALKSKYQYLKNNKESLIRLLKKLNYSYQSSMKIELFNSVLVNVFKRIILGEYTQILRITQISLFVFQIAVVLSNTISSALIVFNFGKTSGKYVGHSTWCLSSLNLIILSLFIFVFYFIGLFLKNFSNVQDKLQNDTSNWSEMNSEDINSYLDRFYLTCMLPYNETTIYDFYKEPEISKNLDLLALHMYNITFYTKYSDPFKIVDFVEQMKNFSDYISNPGMAITNLDKKDTMPYDSLIKTINRIIDFRSALPYQVMNDCGSPTSIEMYIRQNLCTYPINTNPDVTYEDIGSGRLCLILPQISEKDLYRLFYKHFKGCTYSNGKYLDEGYDDIYDELVSGHKIALAFFEEFTKFRDFFINDIIYDSADKYYKFAKKAGEWIETINKDFANKLNSFLHLPIDNNILYYLGKQQDIPKLVNDRLFTFHKYISCSAYSEYLKDIVNYTEYDMMDVTYQLMICSLFLFVYNIISSIFGLMSTLINYANEDSDNSDKKNN